MNVLIMHIISGKCQSAPVLLYHMWEFEKSNRLTPTECVIHFINQLKTSERELTGHWNSTENTKQRMSVDFCNNIRVNSSLALLNKQQKYRQYHVHAAHTLTHTHARARTHTLYCQSISSAELQNSMTLCSESVVRSGYKHLASQCFMRTQAVCDL